MTTSVALVENVRQHLGRIPSKEELAQFLTRPLPKVHWDGVECEIRYDVFKNNEYQLSFCFWDIYYYQSASPQKGLGPGTILNCGSLNSGQNQRFWTAAIDDSRRRAVNSSTTDVVSMVFFARDRGAKSMGQVPDASLTAVQFEILEAAWKSPSGASVAEIWEAIAVSRDVGRTTILNLVDRLEKRGWLARKKIEGVYRYTPTVSREKASESVAAEFVDAFFSGSASELVMSLLGSKKISADEVTRLRKLLDARAREKQGKETRK